MTAGDAATDLDEWETRPCEPRVANEDAEDWCAIAQWESARADRWKAEVADLRRQLEEQKGLQEVVKFRGRLWRRVAGGQTCEGCGVYSEYGDECSIADNAPCGQNVILRRIASEVLTAPDGFEVIEFGSKVGANGFPRIQRKGPASWAVYETPLHCLGKDGNAHPEPLPSSRSNEFIKLTRFATPQDAAAALSMTEDANP